MRTLVARAFDLLLELAAPGRCAVCNLSSRGGLCARCDAEREAPPERSLEGVPIVAAIRYAPPFDRAIQRFKYGSRPDLARQLAKLWSDMPELAADVLVPVPLHARRLAERGYNQSALLAAVLGPRLGLPVDHRSLVRQRHVPKQAGMDRAARLSNVAGAFRVRPGAPISSRRVVLVDDVVTTGATASACIGALRAAGADVTAVLAVASAGS